jgi:succinoglycan biosynthesis transport protein ExoP
MKKLHPNKQETGLVELERSYPMEYEGSYNDFDYDGASSTDDEKNILWAFVSTIQKHWLLILLINLVVTALAIVYVAQKPNFYRAEARIQVNSEINPAAGANSGGSPIIVSNAGADPSYFATQLQILEGAGLMRRVIKTLDLENNQEFLRPKQNKTTTIWGNVKSMFGFGASMDSLQNKPSPNKTSNTLNLKAAESTNLDQEIESLAPFVDRLKGGLAISPVLDSRTSMRETRLIDIEFTHQDPAVAAKIANAIGDAYVLQNLEQKIQSNASAGDFLQKRVAELQAGRAADQLLTSESSRSPKFGSKHRRPKVVELKRSSRTSGK